MAEVYDEALVYEIAFGFRDVPAECDELIALAGRHGRGAASFLELACGPGVHVVEMAGRGIDAVGLDLSSAMCARLEQNAAARGVTVRSVQGDMRRFDLGRRFDLAACLMNSAMHLLTNDDVVAHLRAVGDHLQAGGIYVLEMAHPSNLFGTKRTTKTDWTMERDGIRVHTVWGRERDPFDAMAEIDTTSVVFEVTDRDGAIRRIDSTVPARRITRGCFEALVMLSGCFDVVAWYGSVDTKIPADDTERAWRMVPVLRRRSGEER